MRKHNNPLSALLHKIIYFIYWPQVLVTVYYKNRWGWNKVNCLIYQRGVTYNIDIKVIKLIQASSPNKALPYDECAVDLCSVEQVISSLNNWIYTMEGFNAPTLKNLKTRCHGKNTLPLSHFHARFNNLALMVQRVTSVYLPLLSNLSQSWTGKKRTCLVSVETQWLNNIKV